MGQQQQRRISKTRVRYHDHHHQEQNQHSWTYTTPSKALTTERALLQGKANYRDIQAIGPLFTEEGTRTKSRWASRGPRSVRPSLSWHRGPGPLHARLRSTEGPSFYSFSPRARRACACALKGGAFLREERGSSSFTGMDGQLAASKENVYERPAPPAVFSLARPKARGRGWRDA